MTRFLFKKYKAFIEDFRDLPIGIKLMEILLAVTVFLFAECILISNDCWKEILAKTCIMLCIIDFFVGILCMGSLDK